MRELVCSRLLPSGKCLWRADLLSRTLLLPPSTSPAQCLREGKAINRTRCLVSEEEARCAVLEKSASRQGRVIAYENSRKLSHVPGSDAEGCEMMCAKWPAESEL